MKQICFISALNVIQYLKKKNQDGPFSEDERMSTASVLTAATAGIHRNYFSHSKGS